MFYMSSYGCMSSNQEVVISGEMRAIKSLINRKACGEKDGKKLRSADGYCGSSSFEEMRFLLYFFGRKGNSCFLYLLCRTILVQTRQSETKIDVNFLKIDAHVWKHALTRNT